MVAACGAIIDDVVAPLDALIAPADGAVARGPAGRDRSMTIGACAAGIGISGGRGSVIGGIGLAGSGNGVGLFGSSDSC